MAEWASLDPGTWTVAGVGGSHTFAEVSAPLGVHLHHTTKHKIWQGEYVAVSSLLFRWPKLKPWTGCVALACEQEHFKHHKVEINWDNWLSWCNIFMAMVVQAKPWRAVAGPFG